MNSTKNYGINEVKKMSSQTLLKKIFKGGMNEKQARLFATVFSGRFDKKSSLSN